MMSCCISCLDQTRPLGPEDFQLDFVTGGYQLPRQPVIVFFVDGLHPGTLEQMAAAGELPRLKRHLIDRGTRVEQAVTGVPSITYANAATMITGRYAGHHGIMGNRFFDRDSLTYRRYESLATMGLANRDLSGPTVYELLDDQLTAVVMMQVHRGVKLPVNIFPIEGGLTVGAAWGLGLSLLADRLLVGRLAQVGHYAAQVGQWPDLLLIYLPGVDHVGHIAGHDSVAYRAAVANIDACVGGALETLDRLGLRDRFTVVLTSDHGHALTPAANSLILEDWFPQSLGLPVDDAGPDDRVPYPQRHKYFAQRGAVITREGDRVAHLYLRADTPPDGQAPPDRQPPLADGPGPANVWSPRPTAQQILMAHRGPWHDPRLVSRPLAGAEALSLPAALLTQRGVGHVAVRDGPDRVQLFGRRGLALLSRWTLADSDPSTPPANRRRYSYRVVHGDDPLGFTLDPLAGPLCGGAGHDDRRWLAATAHTPWPDAVVQLVEMFDHPRAGDLVIFAAEGWDFSLDNVGGHGGLTRDEMLIPMIFAGPGIPAGGVIPAARLTDLVPTLLDLMGHGDRLGRAPPLDGISLRPLLQALPQAAKAPGPVAPPIAPAPGPDD